jgi:hypothetical protein
MRIIEVDENQPKPNEVYDLVQMFYPNYSSSDVIAEENDLNKLANREYEEGDCAWEMLQKRYNGNIYDPQIEIDWTNLYSQILEDTMIAMISKIKEI